MSSSASQVLSVQNLHKTYHSTKHTKIAVNDVSFHVAPNEIVGLLGPNGAGKTTTINMVLGILEPSAGSITINGADIVKSRTRALGQTNFAAVYAPLPGNLTVRQNLNVFGRLYSVSDLQQRIEELLVQFDLVKFRDQKGGVLSSGEQTRVCLAKAMLNKPKLLLLDEPTASLDPVTARDIRVQIQNFVSAEKNANNAGVLWTSHNMYEVEEVCDRVLFLANGKILLAGNPKTLPAEHGQASLEDLFVAVAGVAPGAEFVGD